MILYSHWLRARFFPLVAMSLCGGLLTACLLLSGCGGTSANSQPLPIPDPPAPEEVVEDKKPAAPSPEPKSPEETPVAEKVVSESAENPFPRRLETPEFPKDMEWLNSGPLTKQDLKGKFVLFDFWTYCCINCMHILPELKKLERQFPNELVVIGVHSAKFECEEQTANIREAILRYEIEHPVVNDAQHQIWDTFGVSSWPTILMMDSEGKMVWGNSGEFKATLIADILNKAIPYYRQQKSLVETPIKFPLEREKVEDTPLRFPGKILADAASNRLFVADSNHNRIVIATLDGQLLDLIGSGEIGRKDGDYKTCSFDHPQGMALHGETLYVCDTENHLLRKIDLKEAKVTTLAGIGEQADSGFPGFDRFNFVDPPNNRWVGKPKETAINSPWDVWIHENDLYIAMAGPHQIWKMPLDESEIGPYAGNGREDIVDGPLLPTRPYQLGSSSFAQPSGLSSDGVSLFVADSEGSSIRAVPFDRAKEVTTVVGTSELPGGRLFYFGDVDGARDRVKLQHCLGVAYHEGKIFVADTYNNKIKLTDAKTGETTTFVGSGKAGLNDKAPEFDEPAGLSLAAGKLYVADTNNHAIRTVDLATKQVATLKIGGLKPPGASKKTETKPDFSTAPLVKLNPTSIKPTDGKIVLNVEITLPAGWKPNPLARSTYYVEPVNTEVLGVVDRTKFGATKLETATDTWKITLPITANGNDTLRISTNYYYCQTANEGECRTGAVVFEVPLVIAADAAASEATLGYVVPE